MTEENQKKLYDHYKKIAIDGKTDKIRKNAKERAEILLKDYPQFEKKEKPKEKKLILQRRNKNGRLC